MESQYEALRKESLAHTKRFFETRTRCQYAAFVLQDTMKTYLGAPNDAVFAVELDRDLEQTGKRSYAPSDVPLRHLPDGFWYFGLWLHFEKGEDPHFADVILKIGVKSDGDGFVIRWESDYAISAATPELLEPVCKGICSQLLSDYRANATSSNRIGFVW